MKWGRYGNGPPAASIEIKQHVVSLAVIWTVFILLGYSSDVSIRDPRFLNYALVPSVVLFACLWGVFENVCFRSNLARRLAVTFVVFLILFSIVRNYGYVLRFLANSQYAFVKSDEVIYEDFFGQGPEGLDLYTRHGELERRVTLVTWYEDFDEDWMRRLRTKLAKEKAVYIKADEGGRRVLKDLAEAGLRVDQLAVLSHNDAPPLIFRFYKLLGRLGYRKLQQRNVYVYRVTIPTG
jgi:hypothetical protein